MLEYRNVCVCACMRAQGIWSNSMMPNRHDQIGDIGVGINRMSGFNK
jgi:hypothetical protein